MKTDYARNNGSCRVVVLVTLVHASENPASIFGCCCFGVSGEWRLLLSNVRATFVSGVLRC